MLIIGITGSLGTGKTTVANMFKEYGLKILDADKIAKKLMQPNEVCFKPIIRYFKKDILDKGKISNKKLSEIVFNNKKYLNELCRIIHPEVIKEIEKKIRIYKKVKGVKGIIIDAPLLIEAGLHKFVDYLIVVKTSYDLQIDRVLKKMPLKRADILKRINAQMGINKKIK